MDSNVYHLPFEDIVEIESEQADQEQKQALIEFMGELGEWCRNQGIDVESKEFRHQCAGIMALLQVLQMSAERK